MKKNALITGASSGIGKATALKLAHAGYNLIITGRRRERLEELKKFLDPQLCDVELMCFDIRNKDEVRHAWQQLPAEKKEIDLLINNAGLAAGLAPVDKADLADWEQMIDTNLKGLMYISDLVIPGMVERRSGQIINVSSIAGIEVYSQGNMYCATKHAVNALTKGMRIDLLPYNIKVSTISPGMVETEFSLIRFKGDQKRADAVYKGLIPLYAEDVADAIEFMVSRPPHVNVNDMLLMPVSQANAYYTFREKE